MNIVSVLTDSVDAFAYWRKLKQCLKAEGNETMTNCHGLRMPAANGKMRMTDVLYTQGVLRLVQRQHLQIDTNSQMLLLYLCLERENIKKTTINCGFLWSC